jgi:DNA replication ATP-dependent helicase Dna2
VRDNEILEDKRRLTVAITRAKKKLIILSDVRSVEKYTPFREMFGKISGMSKVKLEEGRLGFSWEWIMDRLEDLLSENSDSELASEEY